MLKGLPRLLVVGFGGSGALAGSLRLFLGFSGLKNQLFASCAPRAALSGLIGFHDSFWAGSPLNVAISTSALLAAQM